MRDNRGFVELLRLEPGAAIPLHRHTGEVHAFNLQGTRELCTGERVGPGDYVYEPAGNVDAWKAMGETPLIVFVVVMGAVEYLGPDDAVTPRYTAETLRTEYHRTARRRASSRSISTIRSSSSRQRVRKKPGGRPILPATAAARQRAQGWRR